MSLSTRLSMKSISAERELKRLKGFVSEATEAMEERDRLEAALLEVYRCAGAPASHIKGIVRGVLPAEVLLVESAVFAEDLIARGHCRCHLLVECPNR